MKNLIFNRSLLFSKRNIAAASLLITGCFLFGIPVKATEIPVATTEGISENAVAEIYSERVELTESYSSSYEMYEENMGDIFFFYTNVANGSFSSVPVTFEFSKNITYEFELDGEVIEYENKSSISNPGNYVVRLSGVYDSTEYLSTFRFSIREIEETDNTEDTSSQEVENVLDDADVYGLTQEDFIIDENDEISDEDINNIIENAGNEASTQSSIDYVDGIATDQYTGYNLDFVSDTGMYNITFTSGEVIISNIPNGAIINRSVSFKTSSNEVTATVYKNGDLYEDDTTNFTFKDPGFYTVWFKSSSVSFARFYPEESDYPCITFRIMGAGCNDMDVFNAPKGCKIIAIAINNESLLNDDNSYDFYEDSFWIKQDGYYTFTVYDETAKGSYDVSFRRDRQAPVVTYSITKGVAYLNCNDDDIDLSSCQAYKNGNLVDFNGGVFKGKGNYVINVSDTSGNTSTLSFYLEPSFDTGNFLTILFLFLVAMAAFVYFRLERTVMRVR